MLTLLLAFLLACAPEEATAVDLCVEMREIACECDASTCADEAGYEADCAVYESLDSEEARAELVCKNDVFRDTCDYSEDATEECDQ